MRHLIAAIVIAISVTGCMDLSAPTQRDLREQCENDRRKVFIDGKCLDKTLDNAEEWR